MKFSEVKQDLFTLDDSYFLAHCISADARMGKGIAVEFRRRFNLADLRKEAQTTPLDIGRCYQVGRVHNLVTKARASGKPTYKSLRESLESLRALCDEDKQIQKLGMPLIGCGLDRLQWVKVREILKEVFGDWDGEIVVCSL